MMAVLDTPNVTLTQLDSTPSSLNSIALPERIVLPYEELRDDSQVLDDLLGLSSSSTFYLDQIFAPGCQPSADWTDMLHNSDCEAGNINLGTHSESSRRGHLTSPGHDPSDAMDVDPTIFENALHSYFRIAGCSLPILFEDSFWEDYRSGRCSRSLSCAVACRGMPFTATVDSWAVQQRLARQFQDAFFEAHESLDQKGSIRLDDLEALALMLDFEYDQEYRSAVPSHLARLLLGHDSLVLMTLRSNIRLYPNADSDPPIANSMFSKASERRTLLFWHVYGLDSFQSLDCMTISRIRDDDVDMTEPLSSSHSEGYLDSVLSLAVIARKITQEFCNSPTRQLGIKSKRLDFLYEHLLRWRTHFCPSHLSEQGVSKPARLGGYKDLHYAVLKLLELNCYMQIENYAIKFGIRDSTTIEGEIAGLRVESETLRAAYGILEVSKWAKEIKLEEKSGTSYSSIDSEPRILRNICGGACFWICERGLAPPRSNSANSYSRADPKLTDDGGDLTYRHRQNHFDAASTLREAVAMAISHPDTTQLLTKLDLQLESLSSLLGSTTQV
ncbi:unnamed protein product [Clonostachys rosea]|uniref:Xylanolytic transcriptional activator regulatory domain-containing protein n=1 Tax=Bionectria ochroleuca TaxID=29856 RepID=A0ABY6UC90_BIOOC|nr:unnamed protein product [Clonostachys rosea]